MDDEWVRDEEMEEIMMHVYDVVIEAEEEVLSPEHTLMSAVLLRTLQDVRGQNIRYKNATDAMIKRRLAREAMAFLRDWDSREPFSFYWLAEHLSDDPIEYMKTVYLKAKEWESE